MHVTGVPSCSGFAGAVGEKVNAACPEKGEKPKTGPAAIPKGRRPSEISVSVELAG